MKGRPGEHLPPLNFVRLKDDLTEKLACEISDTDVISAALYPKVCEDFVNFRNTYGPVELLSTRIFLEGPKVGDEFEVSLSRVSLLLL